MSEQLNDDRTLKAEVKVDKKKKLITMYGKELVKEHRDVYMKFLESLVARNSITGQNFDILLK